MTQESLHLLSARQQHLAKIGTTDAAGWSARQQDVRTALNETIGRGLPDLAFASAAEREAEWPLNVKETKNWTHPTLGFSITM